MNITGTTELIAHIGFPTHAFKAPLIYNPYFASAGIDAVVVPMGCDAPNYERVLRSVFVLSNIRGALITMPHKVSTVALLDEASLAVQIAGACNAVKRAADGRLVGDLFDGEGFVRGVRRKGVEPAGQRVLIVGAGGVGCAIAAAFAAADVGALTVFDVRAAAAESLAQRLRQHYPRLDIRVAPPDPSGHDIVVNATPLGMQPGDPLPLDTSRLQPSMLVGDVVMREETTPFLAAAQARGCRTQVGLDMLFEQIPAYLAFFGLPVTTADTLRQLARLPGQPARSPSP
ncbi:MAG: shikimate dehydrogenase [Rubrivivax sp.]|jgi:shikimate dehydrogenase|nr:shikimate dehydrogenase [Rubrivivax sp.]